jgi:hypothetical protein
MKKTFLVEMTSGDNLTLKEESFRVDGAGDLHFLDGEEVVMTVACNYWRTVIEMDWTAKRHQIGL